MEEGPQFQCAKTIVSNLNFFVCTIAEIVGLINVLKYMENKV